MSYDVSYHKDNYQPHIGDGDHEDMDLDDITQHDGNQVNSVY